MRHIAIRCGKITQERHEGSLDFRLQLDAVVENPLAPRQHAEVPEQQERQRVNAGKGHA